MAGPLMWDPAAVVACIVGCFGFGAAVQVFALIARRGQN